MTLPTPSSPRMIGPTILAANLVFSLALCFAAQAQQYGGATTLPEASVSLSGSFGGGFRFATVNTLDIDLTPATVFFDSYSIQSSTVPTYFSIKEFNVPGTFEFKEITAFIRLYPFRLTLDDWGPADLQHFTGRTFNIVPEPGFSMATLRGDFLIRGPESQVIDTFEVSLPPLNEGTSIPARELDIAQYPERVNLDVLQNFAGSAPIFQGTIDGVPLNISATTFVNFVRTVTLTRDQIVLPPSLPPDPPLIEDIPEPSLLTMLAIGWTALFSIRRVHPRMRSCHLG